MTRLWPRSLLGQVLLAVALALLVAQSISAALLYRAAEERREEALLHTVAFRLVVAPTPGAQPAPRRLPSPAQRARHALHRQFGDMPRALRIERTARFPLLAGEQREPALEAALRAIVAEQQSPVGEVVVIRRRAGDDPFLRGTARRARRPAWQDREVLVAGLRNAGDSQWLVARALAPRAEPGALRSLLAQTLLLYLVLVGILAVLLQRITRPLAALTARVDRFARRPEIDGQLAPEGPDDVRHL
ncbi:MAG: sensor histidine kinase, partial [Tsuneonella sp.]